MCSSRCSVHEKRLYPAPAVRPGKNEVAGIPGNPRSVRQPNHKLRHRSGKQERAAATLAPTRGTEGCADLDAELTRLIAKRIYTAKALSWTEKRAFASAVATTITGYGAASIESKGKIWLRFLALPRQLIPLFKARAKLNRPARESSTAPSLSAKEFIATSLARDGHVGKAASVLLREPVPDMPAGVMMKKLLELHPAGTFFTPLERQVDPWTTSGHQDWWQFPRQLEASARLLWAKPLSALPQR